MENWPSKTQSRYLYFLFEVTSKLLYKEPLEKEPPMGTATTLSLSVTLSLRRTCPLLRDCASTNGGINTYAAVAVLPGTVDLGHSSQTKLELVENNTTITLLGEASSQEGATPILTQLPLISRVIFPGPTQRAYLKNSN